MSDRLAVVFPGVGYNVRAPLLHFAEELLKAKGYSVLEVEYSGFPGKIRGNRKKMEEALGLAMKQTEKCLEETEWSGYKDVVFVSKSIGTIAAALYAKEHGVPAAHVFYTPFPETFRFWKETEARRMLPGTDRPAAVAFHGTGDPWMDNDAVIRAAAEAGIPMACTEGADHSLETGDALRDIGILRGVTEETDRFLEGLWQTKAAKNRS